MKRNLLNLTVDLIAAVSLLLMVITGYILRFPLPPTTNRNFELWGMSRHEWGSIHAWAGAGLMVVILIHLILHWDWIFATIRRRFTSTPITSPQRLRAAWITMVVVLVAGGLFAWAAQTNVQEQVRSPGRPHRLQESTALPQGQGRQSAIAVYQRAPRSVLTDSGSRRPGKLFG